MLNVMSLLPVISLAARRLQSSRNVCQLSSFLANLKQYGVPRTDQRYSARLRGKGGKGHCYSLSQILLVLLKSQDVTNSLVFSTLFLFVVCFAGLIHVEIELHAHRQMLQVLNQPKDEKVVLKNTANDEKTNEIDILYPYS